MAFDSKKDTAANLMLFSKVFDCIPHDFILAK
jgi:hypothetical protein